MKKHFMKLMLAVLMLAFGKVFIYSTRPATEAKNYRPSVELNAKEGNFEDAEEFLLADLSFANESVPTELPVVAQKMTKVLKKNTYQKLRTTKLHKLGKKWFKVIEPLLKQYGIPEDFKYLPLIEHGIKGGVSHRGAAGYWQFMPATARAYGLRIGGPKDERLDLRKSTVAACKYIRALNKQLGGNWTLTAAAYNIGAGALISKIKRQKNTNYYTLKMNPETSIYLYKLISMKEIIEKPGKYGYPEALRITPSQQASPEIIKTDTISVLSYIPDIRNISYIR